MKGVTAAHASGWVCCLCYLPISRQVKPDSSTAPVAHKETGAAAHHRCEQMWRNQKRIDTGPLSVYRTDDWKAHVVQVVRYQRSGWVHPDRVLRQCGVEPYEYVPAEEWKPEPPGEFDPEVGF